MAKYVVFIKELAKSHIQTLEICNGLVSRYKDTPETELIIDFTECNFIYPDYIILFLCSIKYVESLGYHVFGTIELDADKKIVNYLAKMGFFKHLKVELPISVSEIDTNSAVQIQEYTSDTQIEVLNSILKVLKDKGSINENVYASLDYCFNEILDNVLNHTDEKRVWVVAQYYDNLNSIRLCVCDYGMGIHKSLN